MLEIAREIIAEHEEDLQEASVAFMFRQPAPASNGKVTLGQAEKVNAEWQALGIDHDFIIWLSLDHYQSMDEHQRRALIHHELMHCDFDQDEKASIRPHDFEEFDKIIRLYGFWQPNGNSTVEAVQAALPMMELKKTGSVVALDVSTLNRN